MTARVYLGSAESMRELGDNNIALTVTSPPYWNAIDYDRYVEDRDQNWKSRAYARGFASYEEFLALLRRAFTEVRRVTRPGGFCAVVVASVLYRGRMMPLPYDLATAMTAIGWRLHQDLIWHKPWSPSRRAGVLVRHPYPGRYHPNLVWEHILVFRKPPEREGETMPRRPRDRLELDTLYALEIGNSLWHVATVPPGRIAHPCPFPEEIPYRLISLYSRRGDTVLDPFMGSGQTLKVARALGRKAIGYDIEAPFVTLAEDRTREPFERGAQLVAKYERVEPGIPIGDTKTRRGVA